MWSRLIGVFACKKTPITTKKTLGALSGGIFSCCGVALTADEVTMFLTAVMIHPFLLPEKNVTLSPLPPGFSNDGVNSDMIGVSCQHNKSLF